MTATRAQGSTQVQILQAIHAGPHDTRRIAEITGRSHPAVSAAATRMAAKGWVIVTHRGPQPGIVALTADGRDALEGVTPAPARVVIGHTQLPLMELFRGSRSWVSVSELAYQEAIPYRTAAARIRRLMRSGLVQVAGVESAAGLMCRMTDDGRREYDRAIGKGRVPGVTEREARAMRKGVRS